MNKNLIKVALRQNAIYIEKKECVAEFKTLNQTTLALMANCASLGFGFSEALLYAINEINLIAKKDILELLREVMGTDKNWTPLVKNWDIPTQERKIDHLITFVANIFGTKGVVLACEHTIPKNTFPLERYNGCPFCGTPFVFEKGVLLGQGSKLKVLELWHEEKLEGHFKNLLSSKTALDATQQDSLKILLDVCIFPSKVTIEMKETQVLVVDMFVSLDKASEASKLFTSPQDIMRYLWFKKTGFLQIIEPKTIINRSIVNSFNISMPPSKNDADFKKGLKLKYTRKECKRVALWLNELSLDIEKSCELMHPKREMWVRFIRALRLAEYSKKEGFEKLKELLDIFYNKVYDVWQGEVDKAKTSMNEEKLFRLLKQRPSLFSRSLFSTMLWFGSEDTLAEFSKVSQKIPARLLATLSMYASFYFKLEGNRMVKPLGGVSKKIGMNQSLALYTQEILDGMVEEVETFFKEEMHRRYGSILNENNSIFIEEMLFKMPMPIGDRSETIQDIPSFLMGTKFKVEGEKVRLFMEWGKGLPAQHLDMDISAQVSYEDKIEYCSYSNLSITGCQHSGDIQSIPNNIGTAEYIDIDIGKLKKADASFVIFTGNAYTSGVLDPNMVIGWMNSLYPMKISEKKGVAYDPSCVQHQIRVTKSLSKGIVFGVLDVQKSEIIWLEMSFSGQTIQTLDTKGVKTLLEKLESKLSIGELLMIKAEAQGLTLIETAQEADEVYDKTWARDSALVGQLLVD